MCSEVSVEMQSSKEIAFSVLAKQWQALENSTPHSFFLSWQWIGLWLKQLPDNYYVLSAKKGDLIVGLVIIVAKQRKVFGLFPVCQWWLNRSGEEVLDQCWTEENGFLVNQAHEAEVYLAMLNFIKNHQGWHEFILGMADEKTCQHFSSIACQQRALIEDIGYAVDYANISNSYEQDVLSRNTRQKIRQSEKLLVAQGDLTTQALTELSEKLDVFNNIKQLHITRWQNTDTPSGFSNRHFLSMLTELIKQPQVEIFTLLHNGARVAYLLNIIHQGKVYFYLSALQTTANPKVKLGMLTHKKAIEYYRERNLNCYDFLAGQARYKASLTNKKYVQAMVVFSRNNWLLAIESIARKFKRYLFNKKG